MNKTEIKERCEEIRQGLGWVEVTSADGNSFDVTVRGALYSQAKDIVATLKNLY